MQICRCGFGCGSYFRTVNYHSAAMDQEDFCSSESYDSLFREIDAYDGDALPPNDSSLSLSSYDLDSTYWSDSDASSSKRDVESAEFYTGIDHDAVYLMNKDDMSNAARAKGKLPTSLRPYDPSTTSSNVLENESDMSQKYAFHEAYGYASESLQQREVSAERLPGADDRLILQAAMQDLSQPKTEVTLPKGLLSVPLLRHQNIALGWMVKRETEGHTCSGGILADDQGLGKTISMIAIIQMHKRLQEKFKSNSFRSINSEDFDLEGDDSNCFDKKKQKMSDDLEIISVDRTSSRKHSNKKKPAAGTLVVCPASVLRQWARELDEKVTKEAKLSVLLYHGSSRTRSASELAKYDVVLTTYSIVTNEVPKQPLVNEEGIEEDRFGYMYRNTMSASSSKKGMKRTYGFDDDVYDRKSGAIARVRWFRVILDEAQTIKNHRTLVARACCSLVAKQRWCLSGTPIQNSIDELYSYFRFLKHYPLRDYKVFLESIKLPISRYASQGYKKLQVVLMSIMLRRTKGTLIDGQPIISLPPKDINLCRVDFSPEERVFYSKLEADIRAQFKAYAAAGTVNQNYASLLLMLLRLRQACNHPLLVQGVSSTSVGRESLGNAKILSKDKLCRLLKLLDTSSAICSECNDLPEDPVVTVCGHVFCFQCVSDYLTGFDNKCPAPDCKGQLSADVVFSKNVLKKHLFGDDSSNSSNSSGFPEKSSLLRKDYASSKIKAALKVLQECCKPNPDVDRTSMASCDGYSSSSGSLCSESDTPKPIKALVFSQWTGMLDLFEAALKRSGLIYRRFDGAMSLAARDKAVKEFNTNPKVKVMLMSLKAGNLGLNLVAACRVILLDLWWNPTAEDQAIDRAHRIGQTQHVVVSRLTIKDTVEDRILALQEDKRKMVASAFGDDKTGGVASGGLKAEDLRFLFGVF